MEASNASHNAPLEKVIAFYRSDPALVLNALKVFTEDERARLALLCFSVAGLRNLSYVISSTCSKKRQHQICASLIKVLVVPYGKFPEAPAL